MPDIEALRLSRQQDAARESFGTEPEPFEATPTTFKRVMVPLACAVVAALALAIALPGAWELIGKGGW